MRTTVELERLAKEREEARLAQYTFLMAGMAVGVVAANTFTPSFG